MHRKNRILEAARYFFAKKGYNESMSDIANAIGIKTPSLYSHFESKDEIVFIVVKNEIDACFQEIDRMVGSVYGRGTEQQLREILFGTLEYMSKDDRLRFFKNVPLIDNAELCRKCIGLQREREMELAQKLEYIFSQGILSNEIRPGSVEAKVYLFLSVLQGILDVMLTFDGSDMETQSYAAGTWEEYWNGTKA